MSEENSNDGADFTGAARYTGVDHEGANFIWAELLAGNRRFARGDTDYEGVDAGERQALAAGQHPVAAVLSCADSRVAPEIIFDQPLGRLFTVRTAGAILDQAVIESLEYAVDHLGVRVIVVLGHQHCGAIEAALHADPDTAAELLHVLKEIQPAIDLAREAELDDAEDVESIHVSQVIERLVDSSAIIRRRLSDGSLYLAGARYVMDTGRVEVLSF